jgi:hypothetical protein
MKSFKEFLRENDSLTDFDKQEIENAAMNPNQNETPRERKNREAQELIRNQQNLRTTAMNPSGSPEFFDNELHMNKPQGIQTEYEDKEEMSVLDMAAITARGTLNAMGQVFGGITPIQKPKPNKPTPTPTPSPFDDNYVASPTTGSRFGYSDKENK